ncbi:MAG TPA: hypothetical protein VMH91_04135 [Candidatus Paceibacterota bacterium]|nr:hypothetical protein [Candidatus Paceibacterota bacterium]
MTIVAVIFYLLCIDSIAANLVAMFGQKWYLKHFRLVSRVFPPAKGWALYYLLLVLFIGWLALQAGFL